MTPVERMGSTGVGCGPGAPSTARDGYRVTMTASRYSLGTTIVPSSARLKRAIRSSRSCSSASRPASPTASNDLSVGP